MIRPESRVRQVRRVLEGSCRGEAGVRWCAWSGLGLEVVIDRPGQQWGLGSGIVGLGVRRICGVRVRIRLRVGLGLALSRVRVRVMIRFLS